MYLSICYTYSLMTINGGNDTLSIRLQLTQTEKILKLKYLVLDSKNYKLPTNSFVFQKVE